MQKRNVPADWADELKLGLDDVAALLQAAA